MPFARYLSEVSVITGLEFELAYHNVAVQSICHYAIETSSKELLNLSR